MRLVTLFMLAAIAPIGLRERFRTRLLALRTLAVRPGAASLDVPVVDDLDEDGDDGRADGPRETASEDDRRRAAGAGDRPPSPS
jgi:hypothetical protein